MRRISIIVLLSLTLSSCGGVVKEPIATFNAKAQIFIYDREFKAEINEAVISVMGENFEEPVLFSGNSVECNGFSVEVFHESNSVFFLPQLILQVLNDRKVTGVYNGIDYFCEFKTNTVLSSIKWGEVYVCFDIFS